MASICYEEEATGFRPSAEAPQAQRERHPASPVPTAACREIAALFPAIRYPSYRPHSPATLRIPRAVQADPIRQAGFLHACWK